MTRSHPKHGGCGPLVSHPFPHTHQCYCGPLPPSSCANATCSGPSPVVPDEASESLAFLYTPSCCTLLPVDVSGATVDLSADLSALTPGCGLDVSTGTSLWLSSVTTLWIRNGVTLTLGFEGSQAEALDAVLIYNGEKSKWASKGLTASLSPPSAVSP